MENASFVYTFCVQTKKDLKASASRSFSQVKGCKYYALSTLPDLRQEAMNIAERFTVLMQQYPVNIFGKYFQIFVTCFLPVAFINYYPSVVLLGKAAGGIKMWQYFAPFVAIVMLGIAAAVWTKGLKRYTGTGN